MLTLETSSRTLRLVSIGSWQDKFMGVSREQYWMTLDRFRFIEAANTSMEEWETALWWWKVGEGGAWVLRSKVLQKLFQASFLLEVDLAEQLQSVPIRNWSPAEEFRSR